VCTPESGQRCMEDCPWAVTAVLGPHNPSVSLRDGAYCNFADETVVMIFSFYFLPAM
jgi:hypothetical protein